MSEGWAYERIPTTVTSVDTWGWVRHVGDWVFYYPCERRCISGCSVTPSFAGARKHVEAA